MGMEGPGTHSIADPFGFERQRLVWHLYYWSEGFRPVDTTKIFACKTLEEEIRAVLSSSVDCEFLEYGLHNTPAKLQKELQNRIDEVSDNGVILLGYGLCSNGTANLLSARHTLVIPRVHDCISLLLGSRELYEREFKKCPGTYYLSKGWIDQKGDPVSSYRKYCEKYGEKRAREFIKLEYANYKRVVFIHTVADSKDYVGYSMEAADFLGIEHAEIQGSLRYIEKLINGEWDAEFLILHPGETISLNCFLGLPSHPCNDSQKKLCG
jgi:hypothetical protein